MAHEKVRPVPLSPSIRPSLPPSLPRSFPRLPRTPSPSINPPPVVLVSPLFFIFIHMIKTHLLSKTSLPFFLPPFLPLQRGVSLPWLFLACLGSIGGILFLALAEGSNGEERRGERGREGRDKARRSMTLASATYWVLTQAPSFPSSLPPSLPPCLPRFQNGSSLK